MSLSDVAGESGGPLMVVIECAGASRGIEVSVDLDGILGDAFQRYTATCRQDGQRTSFTFDTGPNGYIVRHAAPAGMWTALTVLIPDPQNDQATGKEQARCARSPSPASSRSRWSH